MFYLPMTLIAGWGVTPAEVAIALLPLGIALTVLSPFAGRLSDRFGPGPLIAGGSLLVALVVRCCSGSRRRCRTSGSPCCR